MTRTTLLVLVMAAGLPAAKSIPGDSDYTAVRKDVLARLNAADVNLAKCEGALDRSSAELDRVAAGVRDLESEIAELRSRNQVLRALVAGDDEPSTGQRLATALEDVDGPLGLGLGWALGTGQCLGLAWVFNQPGFRSK